MANYSRLKGSSLSFKDLMTEGFGVVTVMNAKVFEYETVKTQFGSTHTASAIWTSLSAMTPASDGYVCGIDTLKIANVTTEGPNKTVTGGQSASPLLKFGKKARLEMQDALGHVDAIDALCGGVAEWDASNKGSLYSLNFGEDFNSNKTIIGESYFVQKGTGEQKNVGIIFYNFLPDSICNLTQDAEGDVAVFDMNGDLIPQEILVGGQASDGTPLDMTHKFFYSIVPR